MDGKALLENLEKMAPGSLVFLLTGLVPTSAVYSSQLLLFGY